MEALISRPTDAQNNFAIVEEREKLRHRIHLCVQEIIGEDAAFSAEVTDLTPHQKMVLLYGIENHTLVLKGERRTDEEIKINNDGTKTDLLMQKYDKVLRRTGIQEPARYLKVIEDMADRALSGL